MTLPPAPAVLLLDAGNTLVFLDVATVARIVEESGVHVSPQDVAGAQRVAQRAYEQHRRANGDHDEGWHLFATELLRGAGVPSAQADPIARTLRRAHDRANLWRRVSPDVRMALERAREAGIRLGVVSNSEGRAQRLLAELGLAEMFEVVLDSAVEGVSKPEPEIFRRALQRMGATAHDTIYAGDMPGVDVAGARNAGLRPVLVDAFDHYPNYDEAPRVRSVAELIDGLLGFGGAGSSL